MRREYLGGLAVVEGVLMLFRDRYAVAVRTESGIRTREGRFPLDRDFWMRFPFLRGVVVLIATFALGIKSMTWAATKSIDEEDEVSVAWLAWTVFVSLFVALALFKVLPLFVADLVVSRDHPVLFNLLDGAVRIAVFLAYVYLIGFLPDVKRLFEYHGAEHKVINAYEQTGELSVKAAKKHSRLHPRCSTSFVVLVLIIAILVFAIVPISLPTAWLVLARLALILPIAGISFEAIMLLAKHAEKGWAQPLLAPGYWVQRLTTREPDEDQLAVAIAAAKGVL